MTSSANVGTGHTVNGEIPPRRVTLDDVVRNLGMGLLEVWAAPRGLDVPVGGVVIPDHAETTPVGPDDIVLGVGLTTDALGSRELVAAAGAAGASAVVVKSPTGSADDLLDAAVAGGVAVLAAAPEVAWAQLHTLLRSASFSSGRPVAPAVESAPLGDLFALANAVAALVGGPTTIEDPHAHVLAYSNLGHAIDEPRRQTILGRRVPDEWVRRLHDGGFYRRLWASGDVIRFAGTSEAAERLAIAVRAGPEILGQIWVAAGTRPLGTEAEAALRQVRDIAALHLVRYHATRNLHHQARGETLRALLTGKGSLDAAAAELGFGPDDRLAVLALDVQADEAAEVALQRERVLNLLTVYWDAYRRRSAQARLGQRIYVLLGVREAEPDLGLVVEDFTRRAATGLSARIRVGIGSAVDCAGDVPRSRADADRVLRVLTADPAAGPVATIADMRTQATLLELADVLAERPHLRAGKLNRLAVHDRDHGTAYIETLNAWLTAFGDVPAAAAAVSVHPNTFRYRLRRLQELSGIDLSDADERLLAHVQLRLRTEREPADAPGAGRDASGAPRLHPQK